MPAQMILKGFDELRAQLAALPETLKRESAPIELAHATAAQAEVVAAYPDVTGELRAGVKVVARAAHGVATLYTLATTAAYAHIYEFGSVHQRPRPTFLPITERGRRDATAAVADLVEAQGLVVGAKRD
jgi:hypothetical protein